MKTTIWPMAEDYWRPSGFFDSATAMVKNKKRNLKSYCAVESMLGFSQMCYKLKDFSSYNVSLIKSKEKM
jgi:hypothetical protein